MRRIGLHRPKVSVKNDEIEWSSRNGVLAATFVVGEPDNDEAPVVVLAEFEPNTRVGAHTHDSDYLEVIMAGSQQVDHQWYTEGDVRIVRAGTVYGPITVGPEGAKVLITFRTGRTRMVPPRQGEEIPVRVPT
ncbi:cupin domain-containing protein [Parafrankia discariae]|uniref:hypothetical protein n=1 Tax=Parafrankia discariae TaxID=365528 RepID=UPI000362CB86|nr:hypothetical protein [Parafrankia discariae]